MPKTKAEKLVFGVLMSLCMVYGMEVYNQALRSGGLTKTGMLISPKELFGLALLVFVIENLYGGRLARKLAFHVVTPGNAQEWKVIVMIQLCTICVMCPSMSMAASILFKDALQKGADGFCVTWLQTILTNIPMALFWQLVVCGPLVRLVNRKVVVPLEKVVSSQ